MRDFFEMVTAIILLVVFFASLIFSIFLFIAFLLSINPSKGTINGVIEKVYTDGIFHTTNEMKIIPGINTHFDADEYAHYTITSSKLLEEARGFVGSGEEVIVTYHCRPTSPFRSGSLGCFADKIEEMKS